MIYFGVRQKQDPMRFRSEEDTKTYYVFVFSSGSFECTAFYKGRQIPYT